MNFLSVSALIDISLRCNKSKAIKWKNILNMEILEHIRTIRDHPEPGVLFYDISTLLGNPKAWKYTIRSLAKRIKQYDINKIIGIESRGFLVAAPLAIELEHALVMVRKKGKLRGATVSQNYGLEYGFDTLEIQTDAVSEGDNVIVIDDVLATGGTAIATTKLLRRMGANVISAAFIIELSKLGGRDRLGLPVNSLVNAETDL